MSLAYRDVKMLKFLFTHCLFFSQADAILGEYLINKGANLFTPLWRTLPFQAIYVLQELRFHINFLNEVLIYLTQKTLFQGK